jgi:transcription-repair coupling factor (superfamily II helicase)
MRDLEIRGAGNILGANQSGHIQDVGLDLYTQLLQEAVRELEEEHGNPVADQETSPGDLPRMDLPLPAGIPESYIEHLPTRLAIYQRLAKVTERSDIPEIQAELRDRFGPLPQEVENLLVVAEVRTLAAAAGVESVIKGGDAIVMSLRVPVGGARVPLQRALGPSVQVGNTQIQMPLRRLGDEWLSRLSRVLERFHVFQESLKNMPAAVPSS